MPYGTKYKQKNRMQVSFTEEQMGFIDKLANINKCCKTEIVRKAVSFYMEMAT